MPSPLPPATQPPARQLSNAQIGSRRRRVARLAREGVSQARLARRFGVSRQRIHQILQAAARRERRRAELRSRNYEIVRLARAGWSARRLGQRFGIARQTVDGIVAAGSGSAPPSR